MESITLSETLTSIGNSAFYDCKGLTSIEIPSGVTSIEASTFSGCSSLASVTIKGNVTSIGASAFSGCSSLASVTIKGNVTSIGDRAFSGCSKLEGIVLPEALTAIGINAFQNSGLTSIEIPEKVTSIGDYAFYGCGSLENVTIKGNVTSIGASMFSGCSSLASVTIEGSVTSIGDYAFSGCSKLESILLPETLTAIGTNAFQNSGLTSITIPNGVTSIGDSAFYGCSELKEITIPAGVTSIGASAFSNCSSLTNLSLPDTVSDIGFNAFSGCSGLTGTFKIPDGVTSIGAWTFENCSNLTSIMIPNSVTSIEHSAFMGCSSLDNVTIPEGVKKLEARTFADCTALETIILPSTLTEIADDERSSSDSQTIGVFNGCTHLTSIALPTNLTKIGSYAFQKSGLTSITIPPSVTSVGKDAFSGCPLSNGITYPCTLDISGAGITSGVTETLSHQWSNWTSNDNGTHFRSCQRDGCNATETEDCTYNKTGYCTVCGAAQSFAVTVSGGNGAGTYKVGESVTITATVPEGQEFVRWNITPEVTFTDGSATTTTATFTMPVSNVTVTAVFEDETVEEPEEPTEPETPSTPSTPSQPTMPSEPEEPSGPSTGDSEGWDDIHDEIADAEDGASIVIDMNGETEVPAEIFEEVAGKDVTIEFDMGDGVKWEVKGIDIPADADFSDLDLGVSMNTDGIPVDVINAITGEATSVQITLAHDGAFGFALTLSAPLGEENAGYWANLYHFDEDAEQLNFETAALIDDDGTVKLRLTHASQYAIVIDDHSHAPVTTLPFIDVNAGDWFYDPVAWAYDNGLMTGTSATTFEPNTSTTRAMIVAILNRLEGGPTADGETFTDVHNGDWYAEAVNWAASKGIIAGFEDGTFRPNDPITREQMAAILYNYAQWKGMDVSARADLSRYSDQPSAWANEVMQWAVGKGLISGTSATTLDPQGHATRAQVAAILQRFLES